MLCKYEQVVEHYATALELLFVPLPLPNLPALSPLTRQCQLTDVLTSYPYRSKTHTEYAPEMAEIYFAYGKTLLKNAIMQNSILGKDWVAGLQLRKVSEHHTSLYFARPPYQVHAEPALNGNKILSFLGDMEEEDDPMVDLFAEVSKPDAEGGEEAGDGDGDGEGKGEGEREDEAEPKDDFNAAWEVLDLACSIYKKHMEGDDKVWLKVADTFITLGGILLETGVLSFCFFHVYISLIMTVHAQRSSIRPSQITALALCLKWSCSHCHRASLRKCITSSASCSISWLASLQMPFITCSMPWRASRHTLSSCRLALWACYCRYLNPLIRRKRTKIKERVRPRPRRPCLPWKKCRTGARAMNLVSDILPHVLFIHTMLIPNYSPRLSNNSF